MAKMLSGGEDPEYIARRLVILAAEDIGLANPQALPIAMAAMHAAKEL
jgi:AAA ATPase central domain protein